MPRNTRSLRIPRFNQFDNYMYNSNGKCVLRMQPPPELQIVDQQKWLKKQARYRRPTNNGIPKDYATICWSTDGGPSALNMLHTSFETLQEAENLPEQSTLNLSTPSVIHGTKECNISAVNMGAVHNDKKGKRLMHNDNHCNTHEDYNTFQATSINQGGFHIQDPNHVSENTHKCDTSFRMPVCVDKQAAIQGYSNTQNHQAYIINTMEKQINTQKTRNGGKYTYRKRQLQSENSPDHTRDPQSTQACTEGVSPLYIDLGDSDYVCQYCNATFWYSERLKGNSHQHYSRYTKGCGGGQVYLKKDIDPPEYFKHLFKNKHFLDNIRAYNQMFSMTSFGAEVDESIYNGKGSYVFKISGEIHHWIGTLCPTNGKDPRFLQLYIYDTENEVRNRKQPFGGTEQSSLKAEIVEKLIRILNEHNELVKLFRTARDKVNEGNVPEFKIQLYIVVGAQEYQLPSSGTLGAIIFQTDPNSQTDYDIIVEYKDRQPKRINKIHSSYMSLQFPLLFVYGQPGYNTKMTLKGVNATRKRKKLSMNMYYKYQLHERSNQFSLLFRAGRLFQQYIVVAYCALEQERIDFIRSKQNNLRTECLSGICDTMAKGDHFGADISQKIILPSSFTGGPRYMYSHYLDALAICRVLGNPQFFITFTCNINWPEIKRRMRKYPELTPSDRPDILDRVFEEKVEDFLTVLKEQRIFGRCIGVLYTIEFQKRGLPHCHTLLWIDAKDKIKNPEEIDNFISAELPDRTSDPKTYRVVADMMMHRPCGNVKPNAACMQEGVCSKHFPKKYNDNTFFDDNGHVHYRRRRTSAYVARGELKLDNTNVVPYSCLLCLMFHAHINVEYCGWSMLIKYLFKYISKGTDRIAARIIKPIGDPGPSSSAPKIKIDEIKNFIDGRFICPPEACWRIFDFPIHHREPAMQIPQRYAKSHFS